MALARLLDLDPDLGTDLPVEVAERLHHALTAPVVDLPPGPYDPAAAAEGPDPASFVVVVDGMVARDVLLGGRRCRQIIASGYPISTRAPEPHLLPAEVRWTVLGPAHGAMLAGTWLRAAQRWPALRTALERRIEREADRLAVQMAICQLPRVEDRILSLMLHLGDAFGRVRTDGIALPFSLTHAELGEMIGAKRSTVTLAITALAEHGLLRRHDDGWVVSADAPLEAPRARARPRSQAARPADEDAIDRPALPEGLQARVPRVRADFAEQERAYEERRNRIEEIRKATAAARRRAQTLREEALRSRPPAAPSTPSPR